jgi:Zn-dependent protease with chaperone function|tara:strand:+ start:108 stop:1256 length:1149 start_codon:yes stop_codon:yes gene_type:complete
MKKFLGLILLFSLSGCLETPTGNLPSISKDEIDKEAERQKRISYAKYIDQMSLVKSIGYRINSLNADICNKTDFNSGITYANENVIGLKIAKFFPSNLNLGPKVSIINIVKNSPADKAGLTVGDIILELEGFTFPEGKNALKKISKHFKDFEEKEIKKIKIDRNGQILKFDINQIKICNYPIIFTQDKIVNAYADGKSIIMTQGMVDYAKDDNEIALVIAHELAHNDRGHLDAKKKNTLIMGSIGFILDLMTIYYSGGTAGGDAQNTEMWSKIGSEAYSVEFEKDADYGGVYYAYRAGYDISNVKNFWERIGSENPKQIAISSTHPATAERYLQIEKTVEEINKKKSDGLALIPNEKEIKTKQEKTKKKKKFDLKKLIKKKE